MKKVYYTILKSLVIAAAFTGLASCIGDDLEDCVDPRGNVRITFRLEKIVEPETSLNEYEIECVDLFIFDAQGRYVTSVSGGPYAEGYEFFTTLPGGEYSFVAWTNRGETYWMNKTIAQCQTDMPMQEELAFFMPCDRNAHLTQDIPDLLYGKQSIRIIDSRHNEVVIPMTPDTYNIRVKVKGLPEMADTFGFTVTDNNQRYTFDNAIVEGEDNFHHVRSCTQSGGELNVSLKTLRLMHDRSPRFVFANASLNETLFDECLVQTILNAYGKWGMTVDFGRTHTFEIVLTYDTKMNVAVSVNGWEYLPAGQTLE